MSKKYARPKGLKSGFNLFFSDFWKREEMAGLSVNSAQPLTANARTVWVNLPEEKKQVRSFH